MGKSYSNISVNIKCATTKDQNFIASITPIQQPEQGIIGIIFVFRNMEDMITLLGNLEDKSREILDLKNKLETIFNSRIEGTFTIDKNWNITLFNSSAETITGYKASEAIGKKCWEIFQSTLCRNIIRKCFRTCICDLSWESY
jgi:PAS domain-containing protein